MKKFSARHTYTSREYLEEELRKHLRTLDEQASLRVRVSPTYDGYEVCLHDHLIVVQHDDLAKRRELGTTPQYIEALLARLRRPDCNAHAYLQGLPVGLYSRMDLLREQYALLRDICQAGQPDKRRGPFQQVRESGQAFWPDWNGNPQTAAQFAWANHELARWLMSQISTQGVREARRRAGEWYLSNLRERRRTRAQKEREKVSSA